MDQKDILKSRAYTEAEVSLIISLWNEGKTVREIREQHFPTRKDQTLWKLLAKRGLAKKKRRRYTQEEIELMIDLYESGQSLKDIREKHFPDRALGNINRVLRSHGVEPNRQSRPWTTKEIGRLRDLLESVEFKSWEEVAVKFPGRTGNACKQAAAKYKLKPEDQKWTIRKDGYYERTRIAPSWSRQLGRELQRIVAKQRATVDEVADRAGVSKTTVSSLLKGLYDVRMDTYVKICNALQVDGGKLLSTALIKKNNEITVNGVKYIEDSELDSTRV